MKYHLDTSRPFPYCPGCGHPHVLFALDEALGATDLPASRLAVVTDIGCVGLADPYFPTLHTVHTLHGRSVAIATGLRLAAESLKPVVLVGDGGAGIGLLHLVHAAQLDVPVTVVVHDNLVYGMTGGQHSGFTPQGMKTATTPGGCPLPPLDLGSILAGAGATFFARTVAPGKEVSGILTEAIRHPGFSCVEVLELCPTFATARGGVTGKDLPELARRRGLGLGILRREPARSSFPARGPAGESIPLGEAEAIQPEPSWRRLDRTARVVAAGRAGERVQSAALLAASAAAAAGLHVSVRTDNPVTQGTGFSLAEVTFSPEPIRFTGLVAPDLVLATAPEGLRELESRGLLAPEAARRRILDASLAPPPGTTFEARDLRGRFGAKNSTLGALVEETAAWWDRAAWISAGRRLSPERRGELEKALALSESNLGR